MSDDQTTPESEGTPEVKGPEPKTYGEDYVKELRQQAAKYRTEKNSAVEEAKAAIAAEYEGKIAAKDTAYTELEGQLGSAGIELAKLRIALSMDVPSDRVLAFADILKGSDEEEIQKSAESAYELFSGSFKRTAPATDPTQGRGGDVLPLNGDKLLQALKNVVGAP